HFYLELQRVGKAREEEYIHEALNLAQKFHLPVVATNDVRFLSPDDFEAHEARVCIYDGRVLHDENRPHLYTESQYFKTPEEMEKLFADIPESLANTVEIAKRCNLTLSLGKPFLPNFPVPEGETLENYLAQEAQAGLLDYLKKQSLSGNPLEAKKYEERLKLELKVINTMGFPGYFLIVADFIRWSKTHGIPVGPGRGSGAGSLVAYCLGITEVDPLKHDLLFERFLNPERISMPDFDIDFCMEGRDRVIEYVAERYGQDCVSQIITYGTMAARAVVRDVGRVLGMPYGYVDKIAKLIPFELGITLDQALEREPLLKKRYEEEDIHTLIDLAKKLEGLTRNAGKHAGGVVIAPTQLTDFTPLYCEPDGSNLITQFDKDDVEAVGLVKFDFLGLRTLTIINWAMETINAKRKKNNESLLNISDIPLDDPLTFDLLKKCETRAVFQLESRGMRDLIRRLQPDCFDDITALVALFRPGPLQSGMVDDFINRKRGTSPVIYSHPDLEPILKSTYGVILYQEQVMQIAQVLAGYSLGSADILRRAMGKKKPDEMARQRAIFLDGATKKNIEPKLANYIFDLMEKFAGYGFNKSHSVAYALIAYQTAWLKAHYPAEFMAAVLSSDMDNTDKLVDFVYECKRMQLILLPPNINTDYYRFTVNKENKIRYGLGAIKGVGESVVMCITDERKNNGNYENLFDLCGRTDHGKLNRRALEALICSGAIDIFIDKNSSLTRASLLASIDKALQFAEQTHHNRSSGQADLFGGDDQINSMQKNMDYVSVPRWTEQIKLAHEKQALGFYMSGHPMKAYQKDFRQLTLAMNELKIQKGQKVDVAGLVISLKTLMTRSGDRMAIVALEDLTGRLDVVVFSDLFDSVRELLSSDQILIVNGEVSSDDFSGGIKLVADSVVSWENFRAGR
ncbi:MAG: DNA polymerase III subunit alpha, partial [Gammaproteobacteria bacterium RIFOXYB2_FULL_38_6]